MQIQQLYTNCLAQAAYFIESDGEAAIIDPLRDYEMYIELSKKNNATIKYIFETHFHADFVSGHFDLASITNAEIVFGPNAKTDIKVHVANDNEEFKLGKIKIKVVHTPGHTPESCCYLLSDENGKTHCIFTGDTLFVGDVGRPDLLDGIMNKEELAGMLYDSIHNKLLKINDDVIIYPAHGAGSACGKNIGKETYSTIGEQKQHNYALQPMKKDFFIKKVTEGIEPAPAYFFKDANLNKQGYAPINKIINSGLTKLNIQDFDAKRKEGVTIIDTRISNEFEQGFITGSFNFGLNGKYAIWAATLLDIFQPVLIIANEEKEKESVERLTRVGFDNILGYLEGGFENWKNEGKRYDMVISVDEEEFELDLKHSEAIILDVRTKSEFDEKHVAKAIHFPLNKIIEKYTSLEKEKEYFIYCGGGYRSMIASSLLKAKGFERIKNVAGGFEMIKNMKVKFESTNKALLN